MYGIISSFCIDDCMTWHTKFCCIQIIYALEIRNYLSLPFNKLIQCSFPEKKPTDIFTSLQYQIRDLTIDKTRQHCKTM